MNTLFFLFNYLKYLLISKTAHGIHSPFVFELYNEVIHKKSRYYAFDKIEQLRQKLLLSQKKIDVKDLGTGKSGKRTISEIVERSAKSSKYGELLFRIGNYFKPGAILELGTSLGIGTSYLASVNPNTNVFTIEGCPSTASEAKKNFELLGLKNTESVIGDFDSVLSSVLSNIQSRWLSGTISTILVFFDGNHRKEPTLKYFTQCLEFANNDSVFIFDDIHWSNEMEEAWKEIKQHPKVSLTIDLFFLGLVFFRKEQVKEHFVIRY